MAKKWYLMESVQFVSACMVGHYLTALWVLIKVVANVALDLGVWSPRDTLSWNIVLYLLDRKQCTKDDNI